jgi:CHAD domain-containing protein
MSVNARETETKYDLPVGTTLPQLDELPQVNGTSRPDEQLLEAEYYDTDDLRLIRAGITLRRRRGGSDAGWHLKLPEGPDTRREIRLPLGRSGARVPRELADMVRVYTRGGPLRPIARLTTKRQRLVLLGPGGESLAEVASDDVSAQTLGDSTTVSRWREVEVELTGGDRRLLKAADELLRRDGLRPAHRTAKLERALAGQFPEPARPARPTRASSAGQVVLAYVWDQAQTLKSLDPMVRRDEPDAVHQMRVAARRLRAALRSFTRLISSPATEHLAEELKWLGGVLGEARDAEVLEGHLEDSLRMVPVEQLIGPVQARLQVHFAPVRAQARAAVLAALDSERYFALLEELDRLVDEPAFQPRAAGPASDVLPREVRRAYRKTRRRMDRARRAAAGEGRDVALHEARKAAKQARYSGEVASLALGQQASQFAKRMKKIQSVLGDHQDAVIARKAERELGIQAHLAGENAFTYGLLHERETHRAGEAQSRARRAWKQASRPRYRKWMS